MLHLYQDTPIGGADILNSLGDVNISTPSEKDALCYDATNNKWVNKSGVLREIVQKSQAEYDALTAEQKHDPTKIYEITDSQTINVDIDDNSVSVGKTWSSSKITEAINGKIKFKTYSSATTSASGDFTTDLTTDKAFIIGAYMSLSSGHGMCIPWVLSGGTTWTIRVISNNTSYIVVNNKTLSITVAYVDLEA